MGSFLDKPNNLSIEIKKLHCVPINENQRKYVYIRKGTTTRCYFSEIKIDGEIIPIIFVSNGSEVRDTNKRVLMDFMITSIFDGVRHQNYDRCFLGELDGKRYVVAVADKPYSESHPENFNKCAREIAVQPGKACSLTFKKGEPCLIIEEENSDNISVKTVIETVVSYESLSEEMDAMSKLLDEIIRLHNEIEKRDPTFFLSDDIQPSGDELMVLYQKYLEAISSYTELENDLESRRDNDKQPKIDLQKEEECLDCLTAENKNGDMTIAKYFICERRSPTSDAIRIHALGPRDETIMVNMKHDKINKFIEGAKRLKRFLGYYPLKDIDYIVNCVKQRMKAPDKPGYKQIKEYIERVYNLNYHFVGVTDDHKPYNDEDTEIGKLRDIYEEDVYQNFNNPTLHLLVNYVLRGYSYDEIKRLMEHDQDPEKLRYNMRWALNVANGILKVERGNPVVAFPQLKRLLRKETDIPVIGK